MTFSFVSSRLGVGVVGVVVALLLLPSSSPSLINERSFTTEKIRQLRDEVSAMFYHAYNGYLEHAHPYDELRPLSCDGVDTWGSYSLTLIDALDTLAVMGNYSEFGRVYRLLSRKTDFEADINVSVFETNIRIVGGLVSAHLMAKRAGVPLEPGWPCQGPLLRLAEDAAQRLLPAFDTPTGMPYGTVNLKHGVPPGETPVTCTAGVGTMIVEFGALSRLTGNPVYEETALRALRSLFDKRSGIGLYGNHIDVLTGKWTATDAGIGAGVDSYYEYLVKGAILLQRPELMHMFRAGYESVEQYLRHDDWYFWVTMKQGGVTMPVFQSLEAFWPGLLSLIGENQKALKTMHNYHQIWKQYGFLPEFYNVAQSAASGKREGNPLRPEFVESAVYLYRATQDPFLLTIGEDVVRAIQHSARTKCGYATVKDVRDHTLEDRMESFFLAETTKYLYLLFDTDNFIHNQGDKATLIKTEHGECVVDAGGYVFNTEAHPIDPALLNCCSSHTGEEVKRHLRTHMLDILDPEFFREFQGDLIPERIQKLAETRKAEMEERRKRKEEQLARLQKQREQEREALRRKKELERKKKEAIDRQLEREAAAAAGGQNGDGSRPQIEPVAFKLEVGQVAEEKVGMGTDFVESKQTGQEGSEEKDVEMREKAKSGPGEEITAEREDSSSLGGRVVEVKPNENVGVGTVEVVDRSSRSSQVVATGGGGDDANGTGVGGSSGLNLKEAVQKLDEAAKDLREALQIPDEAARAVPNPDQDALSPGPSPGLGGEDEDDDDDDDDDFAPPEFDSHESQSRPEHESQPDVLLKRQSKDETTEHITAPADAAVPTGPKKNNNLGEVMEALNEMITKLLPTSARQAVAGGPAPFDLDEFTAKVTKGDEFPVNRSWYDDSSLMSCPAQSFLERFSLQGEFFEQY